MKGEPEPNPRARAQREDLEGLLAGVRECLRAKGPEVLHAWLLEIGLVECFGDDTREKVPVSVDEHRTVDAVVRAVGERWHTLGVFQRAGLLMRVAGPGRGPGRTTSMPAIVPIKQATLRSEVVSASVAFYSKTVDTETGEIVITPERPDPHAVAAVHKAGQWEHIPRLHGLATSPPLRPDGTVTYEPGYDERTGLYYVPAGEVPRGPENPTREDAIRALAQLSEPLCDVPFEAPYHQTAWLAAVVTAVARPAFDGPAPLFLFEASAPGSGKSKLGEMVGVIATGRPPNTLTWMQEPGEQRKLLLSVCLAGAPVVCFDNLKGNFGGAELEQLLTSSAYSARALGKNYAPAPPTLTTFLATGNNARLTADMTRRVVVARIVPKVENPEDRPLDMFRYPDLLGHVRSVRGELVCAALTLVRAYILAGRPAVEAQPWSSHAGWAATVLHALIWAGAADPSLGRMQLRQHADTEAPARTALVRGWAELQRAVGRDTAGLTVREVIAALDEDKASPIEARKFETLRGALEDLCPVEMSTRTVANSLKSFRERIMGGLAFYEGRPDRSGAVRWVVRPAGSAESAGSGSA